MNPGRHAGNMLAVHPKIGAQNAGKQGLVCSKIYKLIINEFYLSTSIACDHEPFVTNRRTSQQWRFVSEMDAK